MTVRSVDLLTARREWQDLLALIGTGHQVLLTRSGQPFAVLSPYTSPTPPQDVSDAAPDPDTAACCTLLESWYGSALFASLLGVSAHRLRDLRRSGLADQALADRLLLLRELAQILFANERRRPGRLWLTSAHSALQSRTPEMLLQRGSTLTDELRHQVLQLARDAFGRR